LTGAFPPLAGNAIVTGDPNAVIGIVANGLHGQIKVNGQVFNGAMPAWHGKLTDAQIAAVLTYIRTSWGNKASPITEAQVKAHK
jgi:mono/diheme cytochrome c family protein